MRQRPDDRMKRRRVNNPGTTRSATISITDVAAIAKVSVGTVSRVFNQNPTVDQDLRKRVLKASRNLGFVPRTLQRCIGLITGRASPALPIGFVSVMTSLVWRYLAAEGYSVELIDISNLEHAYQAHIEGVIAIVFDERITRLTEVPNLPILTINHPIPDHFIHSVRADHCQQAVLAVNHFLKYGHQKIGLIQIEPDEWGSRERLRGYQETLAGQGIALDDSLVQYSALQPVYDVVTRWIRHGVTAILNFGEDTSLEVLHILTNILGVKIGVDISIISLEDIPIYQYFSPPQTTVHQPLEELAQLAASHMIELCHSRNAQPKKKEIVDICLTSTLIVRDSVVQCVNPSLEIKHTS